MKALVIGGTGPTGPVIVDGLFERGYEVAILHSGQHEVEFSLPVEHIHGDVHFEEPLKEALGNRTFDLVVATYGRLRLTCEALAGRCQRFISIGAWSGAWFDANRRDRTFGILYGPPDVDAERDRFYYAIYQAEQMVMEHHRAGHYVATHIRYPMLYGPRQIDNREWSIVRRALDGRRQLIIADGGLKLDNRCYVDNAAQAVLLAIDKPEASAGQIYVVSDEHTLTTRQRVDLIAKALNYEFEFIDLPWEFAKPFHSFAGHFKTHRLIDYGKIKDELGYRDAVPVEEATARTVRWLMENRPAPGGELETQLGDPFDYEAEDRIIAAYRTFAQAVIAAGHKDIPVAHPYRHPKKPNETWQRPKQWTGIRRF